MAKLPFCKPFAKLTGTSLPLYSSHQKFLTFNIIFSGALASVKQLFFEGNDNDGYAPSCGLQSVADGTARAIGHLFAASICCGGPGPGFLKPWCYRYLTEGVTGLLKNLPQDRLRYDSIFSQLFKEVHLRFDFFKYPMFMMKKVA